MPIDEALNPLFATSHQNQQKADCCLASSYACRWRAPFFFFPRSMGQKESGGRDLREADK